MSRAKDPKDVAIAFVMSAPIEVAVAFVQTLGAVVKARASVQPAKAAAGPGKPAAASSRSRGPARAPLTVVAPGDTPAAPTEPSADAPAAGLALS